MFGSVVKYVPGWSLTATLYWCAHAVANVTTCSQLGSGRSAAACAAVRVSSVECLVALATCCSMEWKQADRNREKYGLRFSAAAAMYSKIALYDISRNLIDDKTG